MSSRVMCDLETMGTRAGCAILSIGAVEFDVETGKLGKEFYQVISLQSCIDAGLHINKDTEAWWAKQSPEAQAVVKLAKSKSRKVKDLDKALVLFNEYLGKFKAPKVYGNGADFDNPILISAYHAVELPQGWSAYNGRCYRTLKNDVAPHIKLERVGTYHNALDDAKSQALHAIQIFKYLDDLRKKG